MSPSNRLKDLKKTASTWQWQEKRHTQQAQLVINQHSLQIIATAFSSGSKHDFQLFKDSQTAISEQISCLADSGYQGLANLHAKSWLPKKKSKHRPLSRQEKATNQHLARGRIHIEHVIVKLKVFAILCQRYRNRRRRFSLRFNLIAAIYNLELKLKSWLMQEVYYLL